MGKMFTTKLNIWNGGITNDPRDTAQGVGRMVTGFDIITNPRKMTPYRSSESGDSGASTSQKQNFCIALRTGTTYSLYSLGVKSGVATAEILYKDLTTGSANDLDDNAWASPSANQSASQSTRFECFVYYKKTGLIYGGKGNQYIWAFSPTGTAFAETDADLTSYTNLGQGLVHSKDDILYVPYDNKIAKNNNGSWTTTALTLPSHLYITSICEYGNYLAIACAPLSGVGNSRVFLWDRDASLTTLSESIDWGSGNLKVLEEIDGVLVGISLEGASQISFKDKIIFRYYTGVSATKFKEIIGTMATSVLPIAKQKVNNRLFFMLSTTFNGATREGVWSIGRSSAGTPFSLVHERTPNNDTALSSGVLKNFFIVGDFMFQSYVDNSVYTLSKTDDIANYTSSGIFETKVYDTGEPTLKKDLVGITIVSEFLPSGGQILVKYRTDSTTTFSSAIITHSTQNAISKSAIGAEGLPKDYKQIEFRIESTGGAEPVELTFDEEITGKRPY